MGNGEQSALGDTPEVIDLRSIDRRAALKKGAIVGAAALWATPVVQTVGVSRAAAQDPSVITTTTTSTEPPPVTEICNIQIVVRHNGCIFGLLYDGHHWIQWSDRAPDQIDCIRFSTNHNRVDASWLIAALFTIWVRVTEVSPYLWQLRLPLPKGVELVAGWAQAGDATATGCKQAVVTATTIDFSAS